MHDQSVTMEMVGMTEALKEISFLQSININKDYLIPGIKKIGGVVRKAEQENVPVFTGSTRRSLRSKTTTNGIGSVKLEIAPSSKGKNGRLHVFRFIDGGAEWHDRSTDVSTWRGKEVQRNERASAKVSSGGKANSSYLPAARLVDWVKKKLGASDDEALHVAFRVAKTIGRRGLPKRPITMPTVNQMSNYVITELNRIIHTMVEEIHKYG
jgi:hypothetical protein